jgi:serine/threonine protein kinase
LNHPNIIHFLGLFKTPTGERFIVLEYMEKGSLLDVLRRESETLSFDTLKQM